MKSLVGVFTVKSRSQIKDIIRKERSKGIVIGVDGIPIVEAELNRNGNNYFQSKGHTGSDLLVPPVVTTLS